MARRQVHLERVLGLLVRDVKGRKAGHLEEAHAEVRGGECFLTEYLLGGEGLLERLSVSNLSLLVLRSVGGTRTASSSRHVPWQQMDLSDPRQPKLRCTLEELDAMQPPKPRRGQPKSS